MTGTDPLGRAMLDYQRGGLRGECVYRDGGQTVDGNIRGHYFNPPEEWDDDWLALLDSLDGPLLDIGCGTGQHARLLQEDREVVAIDVSPNAVQAARERGVEDARVMDMFDLEFPRDRFRTVLMNGTQIGLTGSLAGVRNFLADLAYITDERGVAVVDNYDPTGPDDDLLGYRPDPRPGIARRTFHFEYVRRGPDGDEEREVGRTLCFLLFSPNRLREATIGTPWQVTDVLPGDGYYKAVLEKSRN